MTEDYYYISEETKKLLADRSSHKFTKEQLEIIAEMAKEFEKLMEVK